jgi:class 3 adenylate cyclase/tetratricopeptide (TPR) repeat protein
VRDRHDAKEEELLTAIAGLERQRATLGDAVIEPAISALRQQLAQLKAETTTLASAEERKLVTIVFADVSGFTALSEKLDPEKVRELTNSCFECLVPIVQKYGGTVDKFIGDEIMALFGAPVAHEDDAERALRAALEMMDGIAAFNRKHGTELGLHLGVNTGLVVAGHVGAGSRRDYSVMGDAVNLAARLEDASSTGEIFVGPTTYRQTHALFDFKAVPPLNLKGKEAPVQIYQLLGVKAAPKPTRGIEGLRAPLIGRDRELGQIRDAIVELDRGKGAALAIIGEAGVGKSRLIAETRSCLPPNVTWAEGRALSYSAGMSYWLAREIILSLLGVSAQAGQAEIARTLQRSVDVCGQSEVYPYLARLLDLPMEAAVEELVKFLSGEALQGRILEALRDYIRSRARQLPLVLVWEDLHWCDPSSWQVLEALLPLSGDVPLLLLCIARLDDNRVTETFHEAKHPCRTIRLSPLTRKESSSLIQQLLQLDTLSERVRDLILNRAEGNPFFVEELLRSLIDAGVLVLQAGRATAMREIDAIEIPDTLQGVLAARIDCLQPKHKLVLQRASVIGRIFQEQVLAHLSDQNGEGLDASLRELQHREFIQSREQQAAETAGLEEDEYIFKHAITHEVAYSSILLARRKELHHLAAEAIETLFRARLDELSATLGYHFERAGAAKQAAVYLGRAAESAKATFANAEAIGFYESAIRQIAPTEDPELRQMEGRLNEGLGDVLMLVGRQDEARVAFDRARAVVPDPESIWRSRLYRKSGLSHNLQRHYDATRSALDAAESELDRLPETSSAEWWEEKVQVQLERMYLFYWQGMATEMRALAAKYRSAVELRGSAAQRGRFFQMLALSLLSGSRYRPSEECLRLAALAVSESGGSPNLSESAHIRFVLGFVHLWRGNYKEAIQQMKVAFDLAQRIGDLVIRTRCLTYLAVAYRCSGNVENARSAAERALELAIKLQMVEYIAMAKANLAWVAWRRRNDVDAEKLGEEALELWHAMPDPYSFDWMALWPLVAIALNRKDVVRAIELVRGLLNENQHPMPEKLCVATREAIEQWQNGVKKAASSNLEAAVQLATDLHYL